MEPPLRMFPEIEPYHREFLQASPLHTLYVEESGNPQGVPIVVLHGGPGAGTFPAQRQFFDPNFYRIILYDQRGAGKSTPRGETRDNTVAALVVDLEKIRQHLGLEKWLVYGGSWGSTLALAYGVAYPHACLGFILRGVFLMSEAELQWFLVEVRQFYPEHWTALMETLAEVSGTKISKVENLKFTEILEGIQSVLAQKDQEKTNALFFAFAEFEESMMTLLPKKTKTEKQDEHLEIGINIGKIEHHYFRNNRLEAADLLSQIKRIKHLPCIIVQGRYDVICPPRTAFKVHQAWPGSKLVVVPNGGHSAFDPPLTEALLEATQAFKALLLDSNDHEWQPIPVHARGFLIK